MSLLSVTRKSQLIFLLLSNLSNEREVTRIFTLPGAVACRIQLNIRTLQFSYKMGILKGHFPKYCCRHNTCEKFHFPSTFSGRALKFGFSVALPPLTIYITFWKASHAPCIGKLTAKCPLCSSRSPSFSWQPQHLHLNFLLLTASTPSPEHNTIFVSSKNYTQPVSWSSIWHRNLRRALCLFAFVTSLLLHVEKIHYLLLHRLYCSCVLLLWLPPYFATHLISVCGT